MTVGGPSGGLGLAYPRLRSREGSDLIDDDPALLASRKALTTPFSASRNVEKKREAGMNTIMNQRG